VGIESIPDLLRHVTLLTLAVVCAYTDLARRRLYDRATLTGIAAGLCLNAAAGGVGYPGMTTGPGLAGSLAALGCGGLVFLWFFLRGGVTGGDVKYVCAVCSIGGLEHFFALRALFLSSLVGGAMALALMIQKGVMLPGILKALKFTVQPASKGGPGSLAIPYGLAVSLGTLWAWLLVYVL